MILHKRWADRREIEEGREREGENGISREIHNTFKCFRLSGYREIMTILEPQHRQRPEAD